jgi:HSP20 family protein
VIIFLPSDEDHQPEERKGGMNMLVTWSPWQEISRLEQAMNNALENGRASKGATAVPTWTPAFDVFEEQGRVVLVADLPGVDEKDLEISVEKNVLSVKGTRARGLTADATQRRVERPQGTFSRSFTLGSSVDLDKIGAELRSGVLTLTLAKKAEAQPRQIKISVAS